MAGQQIKNVRAQRKRGGKGEKQDESGRDEDMSKEGVRPKMKRDVLKRETREEDETGKGDTGKQTKGKKIKGKNCSYNLFLGGRKAMGKRNYREKDRDGAGGTTSIRMGKRKEVNGRVGSTAYKKKVRISNSQAEEWKRGKWRLRSAT